MTYAAISLLAIGWRFSDDWRTSKLLARALDPRAARRRRRCAF